MKIYIETTPTALRSAFVAPISGGSVAEVCPQTGFLRANAGMATGYRSWSPLIT